MGMTTQAVTTTSQARKTTVAYEYLQIACGISLFLAVLALIFGGIATAHPLWAFAVGGALLGFAGHVWIALMVIKAFGRD